MKFEVVHVGIEAEHYGKCPNCGFSFTDYRSDDLEYVGGPFSKCKTCNSLLKKVGEQPK